MDWGMGGMEWKERSCAGAWREREGEDRQPFKILDSVEAPRDYLLLGLRGEEEQEERTKEEGVGVCVSDGGVVGGGGVRK